jgi:hypothetical protein
MIIKAVAVISSTIPIVRKRRTKGEINLFRCSVIMDKLYDSRANITMPAPIIE